MMEHFISESSAVCSPVFGSPVFRNRIRNWSENCLPDLENGVSCQIMREKCDEKICKDGYIYVILIIRTFGQYVCKKGYRVCSIPEPMQTAEPEQARAAGAG